MSVQRFPKQERLKGRKQVEEVFHQGRSLYKYPVRIVFLFHEGVNKPSSYPVKVGFSVPKRKLAKAVHRNLIKRRMREAYRLNRKAILPYDELQEQGQLWHLVFIFQHTELLEYKIIEKSMVTLLKRIQLQEGNEKGKT